METNYTPPLATYNFRIKECTLEVSKTSGNPMLKVITEICDEPKHRNSDGEEVDINGFEPKPKYISPVAEKDQSGNYVVTKKSLKMLNDFRRACGMEAATEAEAKEIQASHFVQRKFEGLGTPKKGDEMKDAAGAVVRTKAGTPMFHPDAFEISRLITPQ